MRQVYDIGMINFRNIFENVTRCDIKDFIQKENSITVIVNKGDMGKVIGKQGVNIKNLEKKLNKRLKIIEFDPDINTFIKNMTNPIEVRNIEIENKIVIREVIREVRLPDIVVIARALARGNPVVEIDCFPR